MSKALDREHWRRFQIGEPLGRSGVYEIRSMDGNLWIKRLGSFDVDDHDSDEWDQELHRATNGKRYPKRGLMVCPSWDPDFWWLI